MEDYSQPLTSKEALERLADMLAFDSRPLPESLRAGGQPLRKRPFLTVEEWYPYTDSPLLNMANADESRSDPAAMTDFWVRSYLQYLRKNYVRLRSKLPSDDWEFCKSLVVGGRGSGKRDWYHKRQRLLAWECFRPMFRDWFLLEGSETLEKCFGKDSQAGTVYYSFAESRLCAQD